MYTGDYPLNKAVMAVGAHADDVEIHAGGTLEKYFHAGYKVIYVQSTNNMSGQISSLAADGKRQNRQVSTSEILPIRKRECAAAAKEWDTEAIHLDHPQRHYTDENLQKVELRYGAPIPATVPGNVPSILTACEDKDSIARLRDLIVEKDPEVVLTHCIAQENPEHFCTSLLVTRAYWAAVEKGFKGALLHWREHHTTFGPSECRWDTYIDYTPLLTRKMELIGKHECQMPNAMSPTFGHRVVAQGFGRANGVGAAEPFIWVNHTAHRSSAGPVYGPLMAELVNNTR